MMRSINFRLKPFLFIAVILAASFSFLQAVPYHNGKADKNTSKSTLRSASNEISNMQLYEDLQLDSLHLSKEAFIYAMQGLDSLQSAGLVTNDSIISIVDFSLPSSSKRLFVIDLSSGALLFNTFVSHGKNSGREIATRFSNKLNSFASSLGFYITGNTYKGEHGYSLRLNGIEKGINDNALNRGIVMHSAAYVTEKLISKQGYIGRSLGCPAVPVALHKAIIGTIKNGSCLFMYSPDRKYIAHTRIFKSSFLFPQLLVNEEV